MSVAALPALRPLSEFGRELTIAFQSFGPPDPNHAATSKLPQHGFARTARWEFLGKSTSEGSSSSIKLDFGLSSDNLDEATRAVWPYKFGLLYSVTLERESLTTTLVITNDGDEPFEFQTLLHTYFRVKVRIVLRCDEACVLTSDRTSLPFKSPASRTLPIATRSTA